MTKSISTILVVIAVLLSTINTFAQIKNVKTETVKIYGNCEICKTEIEKAGNIRNIAKIEWNKNTQMASLQFDSKKTNQNEILKRIALAGYDNEKYLAPDNVYAKLPGCCQYNRKLKPVIDTTDSGISMKNKHDNHSDSTEKKAIESQNTSQLTPVFENYFSIKEGLVNTHIKASSTKALELIKAIKAVDMTKLSMEEHNVWMTVMKDLSTNAEKIAAATNSAKQREAFALLSKNIYGLVKVSKQETPVYYQYCPMYNNGKGANWLSKEETIKNPYYGSQMLTCGSTQETLHKK